MAGEILDQGISFAQAGKTFARQYKYFEAAVSYDNASLALRTLLDSGVLVQNKQMMILVKEKHDKFRFMYKKYLAKLSPRKRKLIIQREKPIFEVSLTTTEMKGETEQEHYSEEETVHDNAEPPVNEQTAESDDEDVPMALALSPEALKQLSRRSLILPAITVAEVDQEYNPAPVVEATAEVTDQQMSTGDVDSRILELLSRVERLEEENNRLRNSRNNGQPVQETPSDVTHEKREERGQQQAPTSLPPPPSMNISSLMDGNTRWNY